MRRRWFELVLAAGLGALAVTVLARPPQAAAQGRTPALIRGGGSAGVEKEPEYTFTALSGSSAKVQFDRSVLKVPQRYGKLIAVTVVERRPVLWYESSDGALRNVILEEGQALVRISRE